MWKQLVELGNKVFALIRKTEQHDADVKELREDVKAIQQDIKEIRQELRMIAQTLQEVRFEQQREKENAKLSVRCSVCASKISCIASSADCLPAIHKRIRKNKIKDAQQGGEGSETVKPEELAVVRRNVDYFRLLTTT